MKRKPVYKITEQTEAERMSKYKTFAIRLRDYYVNGTDLKRCQLELKSSLALTELIDELTELKRQISLSDAACDLCGNEFLPKQCNLLCEECKNRCICGKCSFGGKSGAKWKWKGPKK